MRDRGRFGKPGVAQVCREMQTKFMDIRVTDDLSVDLPPEILTILGGTGTVRWGATIGAIWNRPESVKDLWRLREKAHQASVRLANFLETIIEQLAKSLP